jgi:epoxyqueuosine reductase
MKERGNKAKEEIILKAKELGFLQVKIASPLKSDKLPFFENWIKKGYNGQMSYLGRPDRLKMRQDSKLIMEKTKSIIMFSYPYSYYSREKSGKNIGFISSYAVNEDYHNFIGEKLKIMEIFLNDKFGSKTKQYIDTGPIFERDLGERSGLGFVGKNTMLINPPSAFFIGEILTDLDLPYDHKVKNLNCGACRLCIDNCPTRALSEPYLLNSNLCISYLTIEHKGVIPLNLRPLIKNKIFGCDDCVIVCPFINDIKDDVPSEYKNLFSCDLIKLLDLNTEDFKKLFLKTPIYRIGLERFHRNVIVALGNVGDEKALHSLNVFNERKKTSILLKEHIVWANYEIQKRIKDKT